MPTNPRWWMLSAGFVLIAVGCGGDHADKLIAQLSHAAPAMRRAAARELGKQPLAEDRVVAALAKSVEDPDADVRRLSAQALGEIGPKAAPSLPALGRVADDPQPQVKLAAALAIHRIDSHDAKALSILDGALRSANGKLMLAVGREGAQAAWAVPALVALLRHESAKVRALAAQTLGSVAPAAGPASPRLRQALRDPDPAVQGAAQEALRRIAEKPAAVPPT